LDYQRLATILLLVLVIVLVMDGISAWLRRRYLLAAHTS
jgi:ABC-type phosphate/phosphonate transport system permease subunit